MIVHEIKKAAKNAMIFVCATIFIFSIFATALILSFTTVALYYNGYFILCVIAALFVLFFVGLFVEAVLYDWRVRNDH